MEELSILASQEIKKTYRLGSKDAVVKREEKKGKHEIKKFVN